MRTTVIRGVGRYPQQPPFDPEHSYPEYPWTTGGRNDVYAAMRRMLEQAGLDAGNAGTPRWNPLGDIVHPGDLVFIKPNLVLHAGAQSSPSEALTTHPSAVRCILDYVCIALAGSGRILVGDSPLQGCDLERLTAETGLDIVTEHVSSLSGLPVEIVDLRVHRAWTPGGVIADRRTVDNLWTEGTEVDLAGSSLHETVPGRGSAPMRVTNYDPSAIDEAHRPGRHCYHFSSWILRSDVVIMMPKLKTHEKVGMTCCVKNVVGCCTRKDTLPHHRKGGPADGGDEYPASSLLKKLHGAIWERIDLLPPPGTRGALDLARRVVQRIVERTGPDPLFHGAWHGNDTIWRTVHDLNRILVYADNEGRMRSEDQRTILHVVDGVTAGEGEGPLCPTPRHLGILAMGTDPWVLDVALARLSGLSPMAMPLLRHHWRTRGDVRGGNDVLLDGAETALSGLEPLAWLRPPRGWLGVLDRPAGKG